MADSYSQTAAADTLETWAKNLMKGHKVVTNAAPLNRKHFEQLCSSPVFRDTLLRVSKQVVSPSQCRHVRVNLQLAKLRKRWACTDSSPIKNKDALAYKKSELVQAQSALQETAAELAITSQKQKEMLQQISSGRQRALLLESTGVQFMTDKKKTENLLQMLNKSLESWQKPKNGDCVAIQENIESVLTALSDLRENLLHSYKGDKEKELQLKKIQTTIWLDASSLLRQYPSHSIVDTLVTLSRRDAAEINRLTDQLNLHEDAVKIKHELMTRVCLKSSLPYCGVSECLSLMSGALIEASLKKKALASAAEKSLQQKEALLASLTLAVKHHHPQQNIRDAVNRLVHTSVTAAGERAAQHRLSAVSSVLAERAVTASREKSHLQQLVRQMNSSQSLCDSKVSQLRTLAASVSTNWSAISKIYSETYSVTGDCSHDLSVTASDVSDEVNLLSTLPMSALTSVKLKGRGKLLKKNLSIHTSDTYQCVDETITSLLDKLLAGSTSSLSVEYLNSAVDRAFHQIRTQASRCKATAEVHRVLKSNSAPLLGTLAIKELCETVDSSDVKLEEAILESLSVCQSQLSESHDVLTRTELAFENWWDQPAKNIEI